MCGFYCIAFMEYMLAGNFCQFIPIYFTPDNYKKKGKIIYKNLRDKYAKGKRQTLLQLKKINEARIYHLEEIKHNELMSEDM